MSGGLRQAEGEGWRCSGGKRLLLYCRRRWPPPRRASPPCKSSALLTRHWWPLTAVACTVSRRARRATAVAALADIALEYRRDRARLDPLHYGFARRLDDLAHGTGVWLSALKGRSTAALRPHVTR